MKVLIAEDDLHIREGLADLLAGEGYEPITAADGSMAMTLFEAEKPALVLLDIMMPGMSGYDVCRAIRARDTQVPVIFISARSEEIDRVLGLELGADDYIMKPFGVREVVARVHAVTRRLRLAQPEVPDSPTQWRMADLEIDARQLRARRADGQSIDLSPRDLKILELLHQRAGQVISRDELYNHAWGRQYLPSSRTLDQQVSQLRKRIETDAANPRIIATVHGVGYRYELS